METTDSGALLEGLERDNLFLARLEHSGERSWYRCNPLFAESIRSLARARLGGKGARSIYEKASGWYEAQQLYDEAIETALAAKSFERAVRLVEKFIDIYGLSEMSTLTRWLERIPKEVILRDPEICLTYAQVILYTSDRFAPETAAQIEPYLRAAEEIWESEGQSEKVGQVSSLRGVILLWQGEMQKAFAYVCRSLEQLPEHDILWRGISLMNAGFEELNAGRILAAQDRILEARALLGASRNLHGVLAATQYLSDIFYWQGDLEQAAQLSRQILEESTGGEEMLDDQGMAWLKLGEVAYERNELQEAQEYVERALELARQRGNEILHAQALGRLARTQAAKGSFAQAQAALKAFEPRVTSAAVLHQIQDLQAQISIRAGETDTLGAWQAAMTAGAADTFHLQREREVFSLARLQIARGEAEEALGLLAGWPAEASENGRVRSQVEALCLQALAHRARADASQAKRALTRALAIAHPKGFRRLFLDEGAEMAALFQEVTPTLTKGSLALYATALSQDFALGTTSQSGGALLIEPLSPQEVRVLRLLVGGLSNAEIARELVVSVNTVKTQVKSIYRKLDIHSRQEARQVARELNLL